MGKRHKHAKQLKSEKAKVKLKAKKTKHLPKGLNVTDPSFKVKKIVIREQLKEHDNSEILSKRKLNVKDLLSRLQHHNTMVRQEAVKELKEILSHHSSEDLVSQFGPLLHGVSALSLDREKDIRRDSLKVLNLILSPISNEQLTPFCDILISHLRCAMTHIDPRIKEDALHFLDVLVQNCSSVLAKNSHKILPNFLDMISKLHTEIGSGRQLTTTISTKNTSVKWRIKVLERLASMFGSITSFYKSQRDVDLTKSAQVIHVQDDTKYIPIYSNIDKNLCEIDFEQNDNTEENGSERAFNAEELRKYIELLMPLIFDSWIEVCPEEKNSDHSAVLINEEAAELLKSIVEIVQSLLEYIDMLNSDSDTDMQLWFRNNFLNGLLKNLLSKYPYSKINVTGRARKRQEDFSAAESRDTCLAQNLGLTHIFVWFTSVRSNDKVLEKQCRSYYSSVLEYINGTLENWSDADNSALPQLSKLLKTLFLKASKAWYETGVSLGTVLQSVVAACFNQSKRELQVQLFTIISEIMLDHTLHELHREPATKEFVSTLPNVLLKPRINENTIQMINKIVLRYRNCIENQLTANHDAIIENARKIQIFGSPDVKRSRLMICNLFYFMDGQIYY